MLYRKYPIPVHCECKSTKGDLRDSQKVQRDRILKSGSVFIVIDNPVDFHNFFVEHGYTRLEMQVPGVLPGVAPEYKEKDVVKFVYQYLKIAEKIYGVYWARNQQGLGTIYGRPDFYFELPPIGGDNE